MQNLLQFHLIYLGESESLREVIVTIAEGEEEGVSPSGDVSDEISVDFIFLLSGDVLDFGDLSRVFPIVELATILFDLP